MIGDVTAYDANDAALLAIVNEWSTPLKTFDARIAQLRTGVTYGSGNAQLVGGTTIFNDLAADQLMGTNALNWFWNYYALDTMVGRKTTDRLN